jgi:AcrR family transcriptional regulator
MDRADPRAVRTRRAIVDAAVEVISTVGISAASMDGIARAAGVSRSTLYRHFAEFGELLIVTLDEIAPAPAAASGTVREQIEQIVLGLGRALREGTWGSIIGSILERAERDPGVRRHHARFTTARRRPLIRLIHRAVNEGILDGDADPGTVATLLVAPLYYQHLVLHRPMTDVQIREHVEATLRANSTAVAMP